MQQALEIASLTKSYGDFVLDHISFSLPMGYIMGLIGPNGAGKTTTIRLILDMIAPDHGSISLFGKDHRVFQQEVKQNIGIVPDGNYFVDEWKMADVEKALSLFYPNWNGGTYHTLLARFGIDEKKRVKELSKGMQMKLMLACAFSYDARLLILDEPTSGLDPVSRDELLEILADYIEDGQHSVLFSTHITGDLEKIADYITYLDMGRLRFTGSREAFTDSYRTVRGDISLLTAAMKEKLIGLRTFHTGYEALIQTADLEYIGTAQSAPASIEDIIIFTGRQSDAVH